MTSTCLLRNNVKVFGKGIQPMLFAHGFGCDQNMWRFITPAFEKDYQIILFDYVGSGKSDRLAYTTERYGNLNGYVQDVLDICRDLALKDMIFVGHSVSSMIGLLASIQEPEFFNRLLLIGPSPCYLNYLPEYVGGFERADIEGLLAMMEKNYMGWANYLAPVIMQNSERPELSHELEESFCSTDPAFASQFAKVTFLSDNRNDLPKVTKPSLIMQCSEDIIAPLEVGNYIHQHLPGSTLAVMKATGHCPHLSHPSETIQVIHDYLQISPSNQNCGVNE
jgi:sigma-B regulation protein RsbQ